MNRFVIIAAGLICFLALSSCSDPSTEPADPKPEPQPKPPVEAEPTAEQPKPERPDRGAMAQQMIERWDIDADDAVSDYEVDENTWRFLARADANGDGKITAEEFGNLRPPDGAPGGGDGTGKGGDGKGFGRGGKGGFGGPRPEPAEVVAQMDKDGDNLISEAEAGEMWRWISGADTDGDGQVSADEMQARREARDAERAAGGGDGGGKGGGGRPEPEPQ